jgi:hypothetical protein
MAFAKRETVKETITIAQVGQYGIRVNDEWLGVNDPLTSSDFVPGSTYDVLVVTGKPTAKYPNGKKYVAQIVGSQNSAPQVTPCVQSGAVIPPPASASTQSIPVVAAKIPLNASDKDVRILRQGVYQAVLQSPGLPGFAATRDEYVNLVKNVAEEIIKTIVG